MREHRRIPFSLREKVPAGRMRVRRSGDFEACFKIQHSAVAVELRRTLTPTPLPMGEGL